MSRIRGFTNGAAWVAEIQGVILNCMEEIFTQEERENLESIILAPGYEGWESRALTIIKSRVGEEWSGVHSYAYLMGQRYKNALPYPDQEKEFWVDDNKKPHLRAYWCLSCGYKVTSMALSGICCHGQPECQRCGHELHEPTCKAGKKSKSGKQAG